MGESEILINFGIALALGALVGIERERYFDIKERASFAGVRTFSIVCLLGAVCGFLTEPVGPWIAIIGLLAVAGFSIATYLGTLKFCEGHIGTTTEFAFIFTYLIGLILPLKINYIGYFIEGRSLGVALGIALTVLLSIKSYTKKLSSNISKEDVSATLKFGIISLVILPFLPKETFDPWGVLSLYNVWLMVVLVSGIGFSGYIATKLLGGRRGLGVTALLGGLWSSTATTMTFANRCRQNPTNFSGYALGVLLACSTMFPRQLVEIYVAGNNMLIQSLLPL